MDRTVRFFSLMLGVLIASFLAGSASANTATVRCVSQQDQISVYDSLSTLGVEAKLKCGEEVEIIGRVKDYVKIRAQNGVEGYVPDSLFASLPPSEIHQDPAPNAGSVPQQAAAQESARPAEKAQTPAGSMPQSATFAELNPATAPAPPAEASAKAAPIVSASQPAVSNSPSLPATSAAVATVPSAARRPVSAATPAADPDDIPGPQPESESADPACRNYFSAYGLTPSQMKWIARNRKKLFANVCPAPDPARVDFVIIFTHDVDFFSATMPDPVHRADGFSDFTALTPIDTGLMSSSDADKARREYVWIFHFAQGTFDPATFSPRRRCQFWKVESNSLGSKAGLRTVEDAFRFVAAANP